MVSSPTCPRTQEGATLPNMRATQLTFTFHFSACLFNSRGVSLIRTYYSSLKTYLFTANTKLKLTGQQDRYEGSAMICTWRNTSLSLRGIAIDPGERVTAGSANGQCDGQWIETRRRTWMSE
jgi:hypothetical protein